MTFLKTKTSSYFELLMKSATWFHIFYAATIKRLSVDENLCLGMINLVLSVAERR